jgi:hypothetical protein
MVDLITVSKNWPIEYNAIKILKYQNASFLVEYTKKCRISKVTYSQFTIFLSDYLTNMFSPLKMLNYVYFKN